ncbi:uncharacterized protein [Maniola hyperantus]|uniref:uncharacterized protein n=1 Tax=Aphantopus hyperantus TaxID=2795564 RepID=UPI0037499379
MAMRHDVMEQSFLPADPPPGPDMGYQPKSDLATEYFNTFNQICENYRSDSDINLRQTSDSLRLTSEILDGGREEFISTDFIVKGRDYQNDYAEKVFLSGKDEQIFQFGQPDASALLRHRARRRYNEEHGLQPPPATSQESGVSVTHVILCQDCLHSKTYVKKGLFKKIIILYKLAPSTKPRSPTDIRVFAVFLSGKDEQIFQFGQPDASALLRHRARRRYNEEHGLQPPPATSQESGMLSSV